MGHQEISRRRTLIRSSILGLLSLSLPKVAVSKRLFEPVTDSGVLHDRYPAIKLDIVSEVVGAAHFDLEKLRNLVDPRPELANATWDFGFGDWESAIDAASHVGRVDIVNYLIGKGSVPTIFTYAMLGNLNIVKALVEASPGIQKSLGPHGISLLQHARTGLASGNGNRSGSERLIEYLERLGDADGSQYLPVDDSEKQQYLGDYIYDAGTQDGFTIKLNMRKMLALGRKGKSGGALFKTGHHTFTYNGAPSVVIRFSIKNDIVDALTIREPGFSITAMKKR